MADFHKPLVIIDLNEYNGMLKTIKALEESVTDDYKVVLAEIVRNFYFKSVISSPFEIINTILQKYNLCVVYNHLNGELFINKK